MITKFALFTPTNQAVSESYDRANKLYFKTGVLDADMQDAVLRVTNRDNYTEYVAKFATTIPSSYGHAIDKTLYAFYREIAEYSVAMFPIEGLSPTTFHELTDRELWSLREVLEERRALIQLVKTMPSVFQRNHKDAFAVPLDLKGSATRVVEDIRQDLYEIVDLMQRLNDELAPNDYLHIENIAYSSYYKSLQNVIGYLESCIEGQNNDTNEFAAMLKRKELDVAGKNKHGLLLCIDSHSKMRRAFNDTRWCFSRFGSAHDWEEYAPEGYVYVWIPKKPEHPNQKFVILTRNGGEVFDEENDKQMDDTTAAEILNRFGVAL